MFLLLFGIRSISEYDVKQRDSDTEGVYLIIAHYLACSFKEKINIGEPNGKEVDDNGSSRDNDV